jgi:hypothetical protein
MYKAIYKINKESLDVVNKKIFTPFIKCYHIHSITIYVNGIAYEEGMDFQLSNYETI